MSTTIRESLANLSNDKDPINQAIAAAALEYLNTRDPAAVAKIPDGGTWIAGEAASLAATGEAGHPDGMLMLEMIALLIGARRYRAPFVDPVAGNGFGPLGFISRRPPESHGGLIAAASRVGVAEEELARYVLLDHGHSVAFGWREGEGRLAVFGSNADPRLFGWELLQPDRFGSPFEDLIWGLPDEALVRLTLAKGTPKWGSGTSLPSAFFMGTLAGRKPQLLGPWLDACAEGSDFSLWIWQHVLCATREFDEACVKLAAKLAPPDRLSLLVTLTGFTGDAYLQAARTAALEAQPRDSAVGLAFLADHFPGDLVTVFHPALQAGQFSERIPEFILRKVFAALAAHWSDGGEAVYQAAPGMPAVLPPAVRGLLTADPAPSVQEIRRWVGRATAEIETKLAKKDASELLVAFWSAVVETRPAPLREELFGLLGSKLKTLRQTAVEGLTADADGDLVARVAALLATGKLDQKLGAAAFFAKLRDPATAETLQAARAAEQNDKVRAALHEALEAIGGKKMPAAEQRQAVEGAFAEFAASLARQATKLKVPATSWLKPESLPPLQATDGTPLPADLVTFLIVKQSKHKTIEAAPDLLLLLGWIDRTTSPAFALALVDGFLDSGQVAADRWALTLGGLLGDNRVIPPLLSRIPGWCDNSRHKLAEYAAQAISLLPGNEPLMVLDTLANRYRSKFKNVGRACAEAFNAAATARGITPDELGDLVVPGFDFDSEGVRRFEWPGGGVSAELGPDFKLSWFDPVTDKTWQSLPASAPEEIKAEARTLGKLLREAVKSQTARLEMALVRQRRWPVARWRELYENHPLLRSFAGSLVWGIYDGSSTLMRTFRRYPNGLLADATGNLEELPESDTAIGMVHPLELDEAALATWQAHLARFKVKPPFAQIDRPVETPDPLHANRREIALTRGKQLGAGTFRSRAEKRGWTRGSVIDAGGVPSYYKTFPGAGFEAILPMEGMYVAIDPTEEIELGAACFVAADTVGRGSYTYDEPGAGDPRVLRFDQVPPIVWSETVADLKAIIGE